MSSGEKDPLIVRGGARLTAVLGPTNTGKTHLAVERMLGHASGMIGLPLRLLAREIYDRVVAQKGPEAAALITGEEKIVPAHPRYFVCTVEAMPLERRVSFLAVDEIQLCADPERGHVFTDRLLRARGDEETMFLGADTMRPVIRQLIPDINFITRTRFSDLTYVGPKKLARLPRRSAVVAFSAAQVYGLAELLRSQRGGAAVVMGALSPRTRNAQVALYQSGEVDFLVATDAIGMGLNMDVDHIAFASLTKFDGEAMRALRPAEIGQIAGRAGRHMNDGTFGPTGECAPFEAALVEQIEQHRFDPVRVLQWRNPALDFSGLDGLIRSLELPPPAKGLARARGADDLAVLRALAAQPELAERAKGPDALRTLWDVCQIPDFRKATLDEHARLLGQIFVHLAENDNRLPTDWLAGHVERIDVTAGDIDTLSARLAQIRVWTYVSHRAGWLADPAHWQERTRAIEDALSDALHEALTQRFIDRRASVLMRRLAEADELNFAVDADGEVTIEGQYAGRLNGFIFEPDPRGDGALGPRTLRHAAARALGPEIAQRAGRLASAAATQIQLSEHGKIWWEGAPVAKLVAGGTVLSPKLQILADDLLQSAARERIQARLELWVREHIAHVLAPLASLAAAQDLEGMARGLAYQIVEQLGSVPRTDVTEAVRALDQPARAILRRYGVRFGAHSVFLPALIKPAAAQLKVLLWAVAEGARDLPAMPAPGLVSVAIEAGAPPLYYERAGFRPCGLRAVRIDMLERLADMLRPPRRIAPTAPLAPAEGEASGPDAPVAEPDAPAAEPVETIEPAAETPSGQEPVPAPAAAVPAEKPGVVAPDGSFAVTADMMSIVGASGPEFEALLRSLGFRARQEADGRLLWRMGRRREPEAQGRAPRPARRRGAERQEESAHPPRREDGAKEKRPARHASRRRHESKDAKPERTAQAAQAPRQAEKPRPQAEKAPDPNSPFAKLAILKQAMTKGP